MVPVLFRSNSVRVCVAVLGVVAVIGGLFMLPAAAQAPQDNALPFTRSYLVTGNYAVVGVDLLKQQADCTTFSPDCYAKGNITVPVCPTTGPVAPGSCIPQGADVLAAFLYWEQITPDPAIVPKAKFRSAGAQAYSTLVKARRSDIELSKQANCLASGKNLTLSMFSADVLRFFPFQQDSTGKSTGMRLVTGTHAIALAEIGKGNNATQGAGASLFFVYRLATEDLRKVVVYDGAYLQSGVAMRQQLQGFYQSWDAKKSAWLTHIVGSGAKNTTERLLFNDNPLATDQVAIVDPFPFPTGGQGGAGSDRAWANPTVDVSSKMNQTSQLSGFGETASTAVDHGKANPADCLSWAAVIFSTIVKDADKDGLPDGLEDAANGLKDPDPADLLNTVNPGGRSLPNLNAMGASSGPRDVFIEMNALYADIGTSPVSYGNANAPFSTIVVPNLITVPGTNHNHLPTPEVVRMLGEALAAAPGSPIVLHADVGNVGAYQSLFGNLPDVTQYLVPTDHARGGELIQERHCNPNLPTQTHPNSPGCHFPAFPGTVGWKFGFEHYRGAAVDGVDGHELTAAQEDQCYATGSYSGGACRRRFDPIRNGLFHYFLYAHALGIPKGKPCLNGTEDADFSGNGVCQGTLTNNPNFHVPRSTSAVADNPGNNALITVGLWDLVNHVGSPLLVASTSFHELGHNWELSHGGKPPSFGNATTPTTAEPNCKPNYPSIMSYLFQINGLLDLNGDSRIDLSRKAYGDTGQIDQTLLNEGDLNDRFLLLPDPALAPFQYRTAWFVPVVLPTFDQDNTQLMPGNLAFKLGVQPAGRYCNGVKFSGSAPSFGRFDGPGLGPSLTTSLIDWDLNPATSTAGQDVNFDGVAGASYRGYDDWSNIRLNQIGSGKNPAGFSLGQGGFEFGQGGFDFGQGGFEFGQGGFDFGQGGFEFGQGGFDFGQGGFDFGQGGFDFGDGAFNFGQGGFDFGQGGFEFGQGGFDYGQGGFDYGNDIDFELVKKIGFTPPLSVKACVIQATGTCTDTVENLHRNKVTWKAPNVGNVSQYRIFRAQGSSIDDDSEVEQVCGNPPTHPTACPSGSTFSFVDTEELPDDEEFTYFVRAVFGNCNPLIETCQSGPSNFATVTAENSAPIAVDDAPAGMAQPSVAFTIAAPGVLANDTDEDSAAKKATLVTQGPAYGTLILNPDGSFTYTYTPPVGGPPPTTDTFKYKADNGKWRTTTIDLSPLSNEVTVTITLNNGPIIN